MITIIFGNCQRQIKYHILKHFGKIELTIGFLNLFMVTDIDWDFSKHFTFYRGCLPMHQNCWVAFKHVYRLLDTDCNVPYLCLAGHGAGQGNVGVQIPHQIFWDPVERENKNHSCGSGFTCKTRNPLSLLICTSTVKNHNIYNYQQSLIVRKNP